MQIWPHQKQEKETMEIHINTLTKSGSEFGVDVCVFTFALAMIGKVLQPRSNVLCNLDGFWMEFLLSFVVDPP